MGFYLRPRVKVGPFRCGLSRSGLSVSTGVPGLRIGAGPRGAYVRVGPAGVSTYLTVPRSGGSNGRPIAPRASPPARADDGVILDDVTGSRVEQLVPAQPSDLLASLNTAAARHRSWPWLLLLTMVLAVAVSPFVVLVGLPAAGAAAWRDRVRRTVVVFYEVDGAPAARFAALVARFTDVANSKKAWHTMARGDVTTTHQLKINSGASSLVRRQPLTRTQAGPPNVASNIAIPTLQSPSTSFYLLPDRVLVRERSRYTEITYDDLRVMACPSRFIETEGVPADTTVVDTTWKYVNKKGGPDRRFKDNKQLPIVLYGQATLSTADGLNAILSFSRVDAASTLAAIVAEMRAPAPVLPAQRPSPQPSPISRDPAPAVRQPRPTRSVPSISGPPSPARHRRPDPSPFAALAERHTAPSTPSATLPAEVSCTVTGEERHQDHLRACLDPASPIVTHLITELGRCRITSGKYAGQTAVEVRIHGKRIGQLTHAMSQRYLPVLAAVEQQGVTLAAEALLSDGPRGVQVDLRMPRRST